LESEEYLDSVFNCTAVAVHYSGIPTLGNNRLAYLPPYCISACENRISSVSSSIIGPPLGTMLKFSMSGDD